MIACSSSSNPVEPQIRDAAADAPADARNDADAGRSFVEARAHRLTRDEIHPEHEGQRAREADVSLANGLVEFVVMGGKKSDGYLQHAGGLIDAMLVRAPGEAAYDGIDELIPLVNGCPIDASEVVIANDGSNGRPAEVLVSGRQVAIPNAVTLLGTGPGACDLDVEVRYALAPLQMALEITTRAINMTDHPVDAHIGDTVLFGSDEAQPYTLPGGFDCSLPLSELQVLGAAHQSLPWAAGLFAADAPLTIVAGGTLRDLAADKGAGMFEYEVVHRTLEPGGQAEATRYLALGRDIAEIAAARFARRGVLLGHVAGRVWSADGPLRGARVSLFAADGPDAFVAQALTDANGSFSAYVPRGKYRAIANGRGDGEHVKVPGRPRVLAEGHAPVASISAIEVSEGRDTPLSVELAPEARVALRVTTPSSGPSAAKITFRAESEIAAPIVAIGERFPYPELGVSNVFWTLDGAVDAAVAPGTYTITASRGPRHAVSVQSHVTLSPGDNPPLSFTLEQEVPSLGYVAIDSHLHAMDSQHGEITRSERVVTDVTEGLDVQVATDHDRVVDYVPVVASLGATGAIVPIAGVELTTPDAGHHTIWPLRFDRDAPNGGGVACWLGGSLDEFYDGYRAMGGTVFQVAHGQSYFDNAGFDLATGSVADLSHFTWRFNAMEIQNGKATWSREGLVPIWYALLAAGHRAAPMGASDSHWRIPEPGSARTYVWLGPQSLDSVPPQQIADAVTKLRTVASTGPVIELESADGTVHLGDSTTLAVGGSLKLRIAVWAPAWMAIDRVKLIEQGSVREQWDATTIPAVARPLPAAPARWFEHEVELSPDRATWYAVEAEGDSDLAPVTPYVVPWAHTAPIFVEPASPAFHGQRRTR